MAIDDDVPDFQNPEDEARYWRSLARDLSVSFSVIGTMFTPCIPQRQRARVDKRGLGRIPSII